MRPGQAKGAAVHHEHQERRLITTTTTTESGQSTLTWERAEGESSAQPDGRLVIHPDGRATCAFTTEDGIPILVQLAGRRVVVAAGEEEPPYPECILLDSAALDAAVEPGTQGEEIAKLSLEWRTIVVDRDARHSIKLAAEVLEEHAHGSAQMLGAAADLDRVLAAWDHAPALIEADTRWAAR
jgi:hypothetical protein